MPGSFVLFSYPKTLLSDNYCERDKLGADASHLWGPVKGSQDSRRAPSSTPVTLPGPLQPGTTSVCRLLLGLLLPTQGSCIDRWEGAVYTLIFSSCHLPITSRGSLNVTEETSKTRKDLSHCSHFWLLLQHLGTINSL